MSSSIEDDVKQIIIERCFLTLSPDDIGNEDDLMEQVGLDSVQILEIVVGLEEVFGITFEDADFEIENFANVAAIAAYVRSKADA